MDAEEIEQYRALQLASATRRRQRSRANCLVNVVAALIAYTYKEKLPSLNLRVKELDKRLPAVV